MKRTLATLLAAALLAAGCTTVHTTRAYNGVRVEDGAQPATTVEIENSGWFLFTFIPLASGDVECPNQVSCRWFRNTVALENNVKVLKGIMQQERVREVGNLTSHRSKETYLIFLLARRACHTSAVLLQPEPQSTSKESK